MNRRIIKQKRKTLEDLYQEINRDHIRLDKEITKNNNTILYSVLRELLNLMRKADSSFCDMRPKIEYLGSYFDGLKVGAPTEYDLNIVLKLEVEYKDIYLDATRVSSFDQTVIFLPAKKVLALRWCDEKLRLSAKQVHSFIQAKLDRALWGLPLENDKRILKIDNKTFKIYKTMSGPAQTLKIQSGDDESNVIDVDLVPTISFMLPVKPNGSKIDFERVAATNLNQYFLVPKPSENEYCWRLAFPFQERFYMRDKNNLKAALKLLKLLRDAQGYHLIASYYIKTIFLWEVIQQPDDFWKNNSLSNIVLHMLKRLRDCLSKAEIKNFWCPEFNILEGKIKIGTCRNWSNRLTKIIRDIENNGDRNPNVIMKYFITPLDPSVPSSH